MTRRTIRLRSAHAAVLARDGIGRDHRADGSFLLDGPSRRAGPLARLKTWMKGYLAMSRLEHVNITVSDPAATAEMLSDLFGWHTRWQGTAIHGGTTIHVGTDDSYLAVYTGPGDKAQTRADDSYLARGGLNHVGVVVDDLDAVEARVAGRGFRTYSHADYEPGRRFYFRDGDGVEFEVVSYA